MTTRVKRRSKRERFAAAFWRRVTVWRDRRVCWPWRGARNAEGYGVVRNGRGQLDYAHRVAYRLRKKKGLGGWLVRHYVCDNPPCCNPYHLRRGTNSDNLTDCWFKRRRQARKKARVA